jgi:hypothetical protein
MRRRLIRHTCVDCGEVEIDDRKASGVLLIFSECEDGKWRCDDCRASFEHEMPQSDDIELKI